ncbi:MAG: hypothetical protein ACOC2J_03630 [bacterium]
MDILDKERILVFNKIDKIDGEKKDELHFRYPEALFISAANGKGKEKLLNYISEIILNNMTTIKIDLPYNKVRLVNQIHEEGEIISEEYSGDSVIVEAKVNKRLANKLEKYKIFKNG